jgi:hypothetical protein
VARSGTVHCACGVANQPKGSRQSSQSASSSASSSSRKASSQGQMRRFAATAAAGGPKIAIGATAVGTMRTSNSRIATGTSRHMPPGGQHRLPVPHPDRALVRDFEREAEQFAEEAVALRRRGAQLVRRALDLAHHAHEVGAHRLLRRGVERGQRHGGAAARRIPVDAALLRVRIGFGKQGGVARREGAAQILRQLLPVLHRELPAHALRQQVPVQRGGDQALVHGLALPPPAQPAARA